MAFFRTYIPTTVATLLSSLALVFAQDQNHASGTVLIHSYSDSRTSSSIMRNLRILNRSNGLVAIPDSLGYFRIPANIGDSLEANIEGHPSMFLIVNRYKYLLFEIDAAIQLREVAISGSRVSSMRYEDLKKVYARKNTLLFEGKPPLYLLSPIGGSPVTFFYELLGKEGKKARKLNSYILADLEYDEIKLRFNKNVVKEVLPELSPDELQSFIDLYTPSIENIRTWTEYELIDYIKASYKSFRSSSSEHFRTRTELPP